MGQLPNCNLDDKPIHVSSSPRTKGGVLCFVRSGFGVIRLKFPRPPHSDPVGEVCCSSSLRFLPFVVRKRCSVLIDLALICNVFIYLQNRFLQLLIIALCCCCPSASA